MIMLRELIGRCARTTHKEENKMKVSMGEGKVLITPVARNDKKVSK